MSELKLFKIRENSYCDSFLVLLIIDDFENRCNVNIRVINNSSKYFSINHSKKKFGFMAKANIEKKSITIAGLDENNKKDDIMVRDVNLRSRGIGTILMNEIVKWCRYHKFKNYSINDLLLSPVDEYLDEHGENNGLRRDKLYHNAGFSIIDRVRDTYIDRYAVIDNACQLKTHDSNLSYEIDIFSYINEKESLVKENNDIKNRFNNLNLSHKNARKIYFKNISSIPYLLNELLVQVIMRLINLPFLILNILFKK